MTAQRQVVEGLVDEQRDYQRAVERAASKEDARRAHEAARQATAAAEAARKAAEDAEDAPLAREHRFSSDPKTHEKLKGFRAELVRQLHRAGRAPSELRGFTSELATVEDDSDADCCAQLAATNTLYLASSDARVIAQKLARERNPGPISFVDLSLAGPAESWNAERHAPVDASDAGFGAVSALLRLSAQRCDLEQVFRKQIGRALIFPDDERLKAADDARGDAKFKRVSRESPGAVFLRKGAGTLGVDARPPPFVFASPGDGQLEAAEKRLRDVAFLRPFDCLVAPTSHRPTWRRDAIGATRHASPRRPGPPRTAPRPTSRATLMSPSPRRPTSRRGSRPRGPSSRASRTTRRASRPPSARSRPWTTPGAPRKRKETVDVRAS